MMFEKLTKQKLTDDMIYVLKFLYRAENDLLLVEAGANERCVAGRFFAYILNYTFADPSYSGPIKLDWDLEYNRKGLQGAAKDMGGNNLIVPDLVLHHRGDDDANVCVIEFKKGRCSPRDSHKLSYMTSVAYRYRFGVQLVLRTDSVDLIWFHEGIEEPFSYETYDVENWKLRTILDENRQYERRRSCTLMITRNCNLHCTYCYEPFKCADKRKEMSFAMAKRLILKEMEFVEQSKDFDELEIDFMGGEPLMNFKLIKQVVEWLERSRLPVPYVCFATTNGTLVDKYEKWLRLHSVTFQLGGSYDGTPEMQRINRGTGEMFDANIKLLHEIYPNQHFHMVISKETLPHLARGVLAVQRMGYELEAALAQGVDWSVDDVSEYRKQLETLAKTYLRESSLKPINLLTRAMVSVAEPPEEVEQKKYCGTGTHMITYDYDGKAYGCHLFTPIVLGENAVEIDGVAYDCSRDITDPECHSCRVKSICPTCAGFNYRFRGSIGKRDHRWCGMVIAQMKVACAFQIKKFSRMKHLTEDERAYAKAG